MSNLMTIEARFLSLETVKQGLNLSEIKTLQRAEVNAQKKKFANSLKLSQLVCNAVEWLNSEEGKALMTEEGLAWSTEEMGLKVFGWQKSFTYKMIRAGKLENEVVETFEQKCTEAEAEGKQPNRSIEGLLKFAKSSAENSEASGESDSEASGEEAEGEAEIEVRIPTILTFTYKSPNGKNVSVRVDAEGTMKTTNTNEEIKDAINVLLAQVLLTETNL